MDRNEYLNIDVEILIDGEREWEPGLFHKFFCAVLALKGRVRGFQFVEFWNPHHWMLQNPTQWALSPLVS